ncbi:hypothetical protein [Streptomyces sp. MMG1121]|uniref:hypothetical protein n=1 Tax=Streptomyces sp. MMG1121 TaxID=1415544 RepID=UPI0006ADEF15|nr:hypothetical protein [Streptomyces sp. MMG1121]KOV60505.1 hypothetical protein ADK64_30510 [Streptomyces sp. MMG1121]
MTHTHRQGRKGRAVAVLVTLLLGLGLAATPAAAAPTAARQNTTTIGTVRTAPTLQGAVSTIRLRHTTSTHHASAVRLHRTTTKKKSFLKKLGIFLLVLVVLVILFIVLAVWLVIRLIRRAFRGRREY